MLTFPAYAKINFGLLILEKRPDGYHDIETVFHRINLFDDIRLDTSSDIIVESSSPEAPSDERNICFKAAVLLQQHLNIKSGVRISIRKNIPVGAGLGGGSSDAAVVLRQLPAFWESSVSEQTLQSLALQLGSDVPFFLKSGSAHAKGRGEILKYFNLDVPYSILLCNPGIHVSTAWAYQHVKPQRRSIDMQQFVEQGMKMSSYLSEIINDFEPAVFQEYPAIKQVKETMLISGAVFSSMSGSGSSVYGLFDDEEKAREAARNLGKRHFTTCITEPHFAAPEL